MPRNTSDKFKTARQRAGKARAARTTINAIVKRSLNSIGVAPQRRMMAQNKAGGLGYADLAGATYVIDTTGSVTLLNLVAQGVATNQRVGKRIRMTSLQCRGYIQANTTAILNDVVVMIVYDKRPTGSAPAVTDFLNSASSEAQNKDDNIPDRFQILKRMHYTLTGNTTAPATGNEAVDADFYMPIRFPVNYKSAATGAIGDIEEGALWLVTIGNNVAGNTAAALRASFRLRFADVQG